MRRPLRHRRRRLLRQSRWRPRPGLRRALVRSRAQLTYGQVQRAVDGAADPAVPDHLSGLLRRVGVEALVLEPHVGQEFRAVVVDVDDDGARGTVVVADPAVEAPVEAAGLPLGEEIAVRLTDVDVPARRVRFSPG